jgi:hypothetical protein
VNLLLVEIESYWGNKILAGKKCSEKVLRQKMIEALKITESEEFTSVFCRMFQFEEYSNSDDVRVDFVIDLDTRLLYSPRY